ncbi:hypothetical protein [Mycobacterium rhizamassiliense]|uniref:hypothetical protein n=1 Tax=Mycobacterium rhizamassiliense TaxID=1841860 RepID=UPI001FE85536|nr:hypothetical protein [Mycobacterium rhizamassiliense]
MTRTLAGGVGALGLVGGHLLGAVGCDFCTGRTGSGCRVTARGAGWVVDGPAADVAVVVGAAGC